nr:MAG: hypothetical protein [Bacteriophage sp.]UVX43924.1 MAG: hypothetical protein [Bacteriophage sp.]UVX46903.1 MAG: hypothetical protein [Bacteriophage sp.]UVX56980.1 MAG: hypothetical protein [Bacteriophage sp.]
MREGGGEPGKLPKEMKKRKRPFSEKGDCYLDSTLKNFSKNKKGLLQTWKNAQISSFKC